MKVWENCRSREIGTCPFFQFAKYHSGYTSKFGPETWNSCAYHLNYLRNIKKCKFAGTKQSIAAAGIAFVIKQKTGEKV